MLKWHENKSIGQFGGENKIHELFFPFDPLFPLNGHRDFYCQTSANYPSIDLESAVDHLYDTYDKLLRNESTYLMSHHYVIFDKLVTSINLVKNSNVFLESSVLLIFDTSTNILAYLIKHRHLRKKSLDLGH